MRLAIFLCIGCSQSAPPPKHLSAPWLFQRGQVHDQVDILFMLDDSSDADPKELAVREYFSELIQRLGASGFPTSYHIGVVTSDLGAGAAMNGGCKVGGLGARLQALGRAHPAPCLPPADGQHYLIHDQIGGSDNTPAGQDLLDSFTCMASVGSGGCGFQHPLESVYRALHDCQSADSCTIQENQGFLRPDALLAVVFVTDEDDC